MAHPNVVFMGVCGCGKSTVARRYADVTGRVLIEADDFHPPANVAKMRSGQPLTDADRAGWLAALALRIAEGKARGEGMVLTCSALTKAGLSALNESLMMEVSGTKVVILDVRPGDYRTDFEGSVRRPPSASVPSLRLARAWTAFGAMMASGPAPAQAAAELRRALLRNRSGTVRIGRFFQAVIAPFISRFGSLALKRRIQASYFNVS